MSKLPAVPKGDDIAADEFGDLPLAPTAIAPKKPALRPPKGGVPKGTWRGARDVLTSLLFWVARIDD